MTRVELVTDSDVVSYIYRRGSLGKAYSDLIGLRRTGITLLAVAEARVGVTHANWGERRIASLHAFLGRFFLLEPDPEIANICGLVAQFFEGNAEKTALWFKTRNPLLGDISPRDMIRFGRYEKLRRFVMEALEENSAGEEGKGGVDASQAAAATS